LLKREGDEPPELLDCLSLLPRNRVAFSVPRTLPPLPPDLSLPPPVRFKDASRWLSDIEEEVDEDEALPLSLPTLWLAPVAPTAEAESD